MRVRLDVAYDGTDFSGWAEQPGRRTVSGTLSAGIAQILRLDREPKIVVAGRTDAGVHALGQVTHVDLDAVDLAEFHRRLAGVLPADIVLLAAREVSGDFDARFSATARHYRYRITDGPPDPTQRRTVLAWPRSLDATAMHAAAQGLIGEHDFAAYCKAREGASSIRRLLSLDVTRGGGDVITVLASGQAFCHNQVRSMVGALIAVGEGRHSTRWPGEVLAAAVRSSAVTVAPPHGLTLMRVDY